MTRGAARRLRSGRVAVLVGACALLLGARPARAWDVNALVLEAAARQREGELSAGRITLERVEVETDLDAAGGRKKPERRRYSVVMDGRGIVGRELLEVDGREPTEDEKEKSRREDEKRRRASLEANGARADEEELMSGRVPLLDLLPRLKFQLVGEELLDGRPTHVVAFGPKPGLVPKSIRDRVLNNFAGTTWIDVAEQQVRKIDGHLTVPVKVLGGALLDLRGVRLVYESREVLPGTWAPCREEIGITATAGMVLGFRREIRFEFSNYRSARPDVPSARPAEAVRRLAGPARRTVPASEPSEGALDHSSAEGDRVGSRRRGDAPGSGGRLADGDPDLGDDSEVR